ncbi:MAG: hypothetical protein ABRQ38_22585, partial [Candidatus Eremiobacterota bacterium]
MSLKYVILFILLILSTGIYTVSGQTENTVTSETPSLTSLPSFTPDLDSVIPEATMVPSLTPVTDKTSVPEEKTATAIPETGKIPSLTPVTDKTSVPEEKTSTVIPETGKIPFLTPVTDKTSVPEEKTATAIPDSNSLPSATSAPVSVPDVKSTVHKKKNVPVIFYEEELFSVNTAMGPYSPEERVSIILNRLQKVSDDKFFNPEEIKVDIKDSHPCIIYKDIVIMTLSQEDGKHEGLSDREVADKYARKIINTLKTYKEERSFKTIIYGIIYSLITTLIFALLLIILDRLLALI